MSFEYLSRRDASDHLAGLGIKCAVSTLANLATLGGGPEMVKFGSRVLYTRESLNHWVDERTIVRRDTSDPGRRLTKLAVPEIVQNAVR